MMQRRNQQEWGYYNLPVTMGGIYLAKPLTGKALIVLCYPRYGCNLEWVKLKAIEKTSLLVVQGSR
jgi:hypothetical protein